MAYLSISEHSTTQIVAVLYELDTSYDETIRIATWSCYEIIENSDGTETYELVEEEQTTIAEKVSTASYVFSSLTPSTRYKITVVISNIQGSSDRKFMITQSTLDEGGTVYPSNRPNIESFFAYQTAVGKKIIEYVIKINALKRDSQVVVSCEKEDETWYYSIEYDTKSGYEVKDTASFVVPDFGSYIIKLYAMNPGSETDYEINRYTLVEVVDDTPRCTLNCTFEDRVYSYDSGRVTGTIYNYPVIAVADFNQFCTDINTVRTKCGMPEYGDFITVNSGEEMSYSVFEHLYYAIMTIYINKDGLEWDDSFPSVAPTKSGIAITREFIEGLVSALIKARNYIFNIQEGI